MTMCPFPQDREILAKGLPIDNAAGNLVHPIICSVHRSALVHSTKARKLSVFEQSRCLALFQFCVRFCEGVDGKFQVFTRMRRRDLCANTRRTMRNDRVEEADDVNAFFKHSSSELL